MCGGRRAGRGGRRRRGVGGIGRLPFIGGTAINLAHRLSGKPAEGQGPLSPSG